VPDLRYLIIVSGPATIAAAKSAGVFRGDRDRPCNARTSRARTSGYRAMIKRLRPGSFTSSLAAARALSNALRIRGGLHRSHGIPGAPQGHPFGPPHGLSGCSWQAHWAPPHAGHRSCAMAIVPEQRVSSRRVPIRQTWARTAAAAPRRGRARSSNLSDHFQSAGRSAPEARYGREPSRHIFS
jgi:hypothetical protein